VKTITVKADLNGVRTVDSSGADTGDAPIISVDTVDPQGVSSGNDTIVTNSVSGDTAEVDLAGNVQYIRQSKPTLASASLPSTILGSGEKVLYRWTVTADSKGEIGWMRLVFDMSGNMDYPSGTSNTIGCGAANCTETSGVYMATSSEVATTPTQLMATSSLKVYDLTNNQQVTASSGSAWVTVTNASGIARITFVPSAEQVVAAGETKTYELRGTLLTGGDTGDVLQTKLSDVATGATTTDYYEVKASSASTSFIWTDRSGAADTHSLTSADWTHDYKVSGIPTATLSLSR
jgi:hypothetical protein